MHRPAKAHPRQVNSILDSVFGALGLTESYHGWRIVYEWDKILGSELAREAPAHRYQDGVIYVAVSSPSLRQNLQLQLDELMISIKNHPSGGAVRELRLISTRKRKAPHGHQR